MDTAIKTKWLAALRSGEYKQARGSLEEVQDGESCFCCLGVLCDLAAKEGIVVRAERDQGHIIDATYTSVVDPEDYSEAVLPKAVRDWAGLSDDNPKVEITEEIAKRIDNDLLYPAHDISSLTEVNDETGIGFEGIADLIEVNF